MESTPKETILPILQFKEDILEKITNNPITIICGETGCGKTTQVPQYIIRADPNANVIVTQPRRIAAVSVAERVSSQLGTKTGSLVGYHIGMDCRTSKNTRISYVTTGILLEKLTNDSKFLDTYTHVIFDEVHERGIECDFSLIAIKLNLCRKINKQTRIIVMSATLNSNLFRQFFAQRQNGDFIKATIKIETKQRQIRRGDRRKRSESEEQIEYTSKLEIKQTDKLAPCVTLPTLRKFNINIKYLEDITQNAGSSGETPYFDQFKLNLAVKLCSQNTELGDILIFVPGMRQIKLVSNAIKQKQINCQLFQLHSQFNTSVSKLFAKSEIPKIIVSTNIAESSITLPDVKIIIDFCITKQHEYNEKTNFQRLQMVWASKASMIQRAGRVGRVSDGTVYRLIRKQEYQNFEEYDLSEMKRSSLQKTILRIKKLDVLTLKEQLVIFSDVYEVLANAFQPPDVTKIDKTIQKLVFQQALIADQRTVKPSVPKYLNTKLTISQLGTYIVQMPCDIHLAKMIIVASALGVHEQMIDIVAIMCYRKPFFVNFEKRMKPQNYVHHVINYDQNGFNDFSVKQRIFADWLENFYFPWKKENYKRFQVKQKQTEVREEEDMYVETYKKTLIDGSRLINGFISERVNNKQIEWCTERCVYANNFREILSLRQSIRAKVSRKLTINYRDNPYSYTDQNILQLVCLLVGFKNNLIDLTLEKTSGSYRREEEKNNQISLLLRDVKFGQDDLYSFITAKSRNLPELDIKKEYLNMRVSGPLKYLAKLRLPYKFRKTYLPQSVSPIFAYLTANQPTYEYSFTLKEKRHHRGVNVDEQSLNKSQFYSGPFQGYLLTNQFIESTRGLLAKNTCWISSQQAILSLIAFSKSVKFIWNKTQQFFTSVKVDKVEYPLPFYVTKKLLTTLQSLRKAVKNIFDINSSNKINSNQLIDTILYLMDNCDIIEELPRVEFWEDLYAQQEGFNRSSVKYSEQIDDMKSVPEVSNSYHVKYKKWKRRLLKQMETQIVQFKYNYCILVCEHCLPDISIVCTLDNINKEKRIFIEKQSTSEWIVRDNQLYCRGSSGHNIGYLSQDNPIIDCEKNISLRYPNGSLKKISLSDADFKEIETDESDQKKWIQSKQKNSGQYECKVCYDEGYHHTEKSYETFRKHCYLSKHRERQKLFKQFM